MGSLTYVFGFWVLVSSLLTSCERPTYPKAMIPESIINLCREEYNVEVDTKLVGNTLAVYLPAENLFDAVLNLDEKASKKINDVILGVSRVTLSTDARFDFYIVIAQDPKMPEVEIVYIRYVDDVKRFLLGDISRGEYAKRAVIKLKTPPQAERERVLKELFNKLNIESPDEMVKDYFTAEQNVSGIDEISYWNKSFFIKEIGLSEFLASQIDERIKIEFRQDKDLNKWYELKSSEGKFSKEKGKQGFFMFNVNIADRVEPLYFESGLELDARRKNLLVFKKLFSIAGNVLWAYKFEDFTEVGISIPSRNKVIVKDALYKFRRGKVKIEDLI